MVLSKVTALLFFLLFVFFLGSQAFAQTTSQQAPQTTQLRSQPTSQRAGGTLQARTLMEIERRIAALTNVSQRAETSQIPDATKQALMAEMQAEITSLTELKTQIEAESDATALGALAASVVSSYRVYALYVPKVMILSTAERLLKVADLLTVVKDKILETAVSSGQEVSEIETLLTDAEDQIVAGRASAESAMETVSALEPAGYPGNKTSLQDARADLVEARTSLMSARQSLGEALTAWQSLQSSGSAETSGQEDVMMPSSSTRPTTLPQATSGSEAF